LNLRPLPCKGNALPLSYKRIFEEFLVKYI
jgi:hypothetical protein